MRIKESILESIKTKQLLLEDEKLIGIIQDIADQCISTFNKDGKVLLCGNGGSASDAQHIAAELSGRFNYDRAPLYAEALHVNSSYVTAVANDYSYDVIYSRMIKAAGRKGDICIGISTSGNSKNVVNALLEANNQGMITVAFTGSNIGKMDEIADYCVKIPSTDTARIQEAHILVGHVICEEIESNLFPKTS